MSHPVSMPLSELRLLNAIAGALVILIALAVLRSLKGRRRALHTARPEQHPYPRRTPVSATQLVHGLGRAGRWWGSVLFWRIVYPALYPLSLFIATRRGHLVADDLRVLEQHLAANNHRCPHAVCVPVLVWPHWFVRCRACAQWLHMREVPSLDGDGVDLMVVRGTLETTRCPRRYVMARAAPPVQPPPVATPAMQPAPQPQPTPEPAKTA